MRTVTFPGTSWLQAINVHNKIAEEYGRDLRFGRTCQNLDVSSISADGVAVPHSDANRRKKKKQVTTGLSGQT